MEADADKYSRESINRFNFSLDFLNKIMGWSKKDSFSPSREEIASLHKLHHMLTSDRSGGLKNYTTSQGMIKSYLRYYLPLNFEKGSLIYNRHRLVFQKHIQSTLPSSTFRILDYGGGPGTASLSFLAYFQKDLTHFSSINIDIYEKSNLWKPLSLPFWQSVAQLLNLNSSLKIEFHDQKPTQSHDLLLAWNVFNELSQGTETTEFQKTLSQSPLSFLMEPSHRVASQKLIRLRKRVLQEQKILGPCLHEKTCPLEKSQHWCHFAEPMSNSFLKKLGQKVFDSARDWVKFSYLLLENRQKTAQETVPSFLTKNDDHFLAIGDLHLHQKRFEAIDLCSPDQKTILDWPRGKVPPLPKHHARRGSILTLHNNKVISVKNFKN